MKMSLLLLLLLIFVTCNNALALPTLPEIESALKQSSDLRKDQKTTVSVKDEEVQIATYIAAGSTQINNDCKIEAILFARTVMNKFADVVRVVVNFHDPRNLRTFKQVVVTKPELVAFGTGQVNDSELLAAIRLEEKLDPGVAAAETKAKEEKIGKKGEHVEASKQVYKQALEKGENPEGKWITYHAPGLAFDYPGVWAINKELEGETLVSFKSTLTTYRTATMGLRLYRSPDKKSVLDKAKEVASRHQKYKGFQMTKKSDFVRFGVGKAITGLAENFSAANSKEGVLTFERHIYFGWPGYVYKFYITAGKDDYNHINLLFDHLLATARIESAPPKQ